MTPPLATVEALLNDTKIANYKGDIGEIVSGMTCEAQVITDEKYGNPTEEQKQNSRNIAYGFGYVSAGLAAIPSLLSPVFAISSVVIFAGLHNW